MITPTNGSTLPAGAVTFEWCNANADYFLTIESVVGAHDIFFAFVGGIGPGAGVVSVTLGPACAPVSPIQCIPPNGEIIHVTLDTVRSKTILSSFQYTYTAASPTNPDITMTFHMPPNGASATTSGLGPLAVIYGQMSTSMTTNPVAIANFGFTSGAGAGALITEASVPAATVLTAARLFVDFNASTGQDSGVALVNPGASPLSVNVILMSQTGVASTCPNVQVAAHGHTALFASQFGCPSLASPFLGTLTFTAAGPFAAVNLRAAQNGHAEQIFSALPVVDPTVAPAGTNLIFSQIVDGGGNPTQILLMNTSGSPISGIISLFDDTGNPIALDFGGGLVISQPYSISGNGVQKFSTTGQGTLKVAYAVVTPTSGQLPSGASIFGSRGATGVASQAGVLNAPQTNNARVYIERTSAPLNRNTGIAIVNRNASSANVTLHLVSLDGSFDQTTSKTYSANAHDAEFIDQFFPAGAVPVDFKGVLAIQSNQPLAIVTLRLTNNQRSEEIFSTLPVADLNNPPLGPLFLPQVVNGGGYKTQIIVLGTSLGLGAVNINFFDDTGGIVPLAQLL
ncbi:MAG: hypothetical protein LAO31_17620 [Acidobacteriia bacterium]|nr:hypothetical protein [Terriglobia bacterium]